MRVQCGMFSRTRELPHERGDHEGAARTGSAVLVSHVLRGHRRCPLVSQIAAETPRTFRSGRRQLRNLSTQQDIYHNTTFSYSTSLTSIGMVPSEGVTVTINEATGAGWAATAAHAGLATEHCGLYQGNAAAAGGDPSTAEGVIACTL